MLELKMRFFCVSLLCLLCLYAIKGDLNGIFGPCCHEGVQWSSTSYRCDNYPTPIDNISDSDQAACLSVIEVCCIKQTQLQTCEDGKQTALDNSVCAIRDADPGAEQFRECCHCCQLGLVSRMSESTCQSPDLGEPCDSKYRECCQGLETSNISYIGIKRENNEDLTRNTSQVTEDNIDECNIFPGNVCSHICVDMPRGFYCSCPEGLHLDVNDNRTCTDKVEESTTSTTLPAETQSCELNNPCEQRCIDNKLTGIECQCYDGYHLATDLISCEDIDECAQGLAVCATGQRCVNTRGHFTCTASQCPAGSQLNPITSQCESYVQQCGIGFSYNTVSRTCEDINECGLGIDACGTGERCENAVGSYVCRRERHCGTGYTLDESSQSCIDNDECTLGTHNCNGGYRCQNVQGSFRCVQRTCPEGYRFVTAKGECVLVQCPVGLKSNEAGNCVDIDECEEYGLAVCNRHQKCVNTRGSYYCRNFVNCPPGYEPTENNGCHDIDECYRGTHKCGIEQQCINRQGTYFCQCPRGMRHDTSGRCMDVDECSYGATICPSNSKCVNTVGSYKCDCIDGLVSDENDGCTDVNECETEGVCQQSCVNVLGTFFCSCSRGYQLRDDKRSCEDIDECTQFGNRIGRSGVCGGKCINLPGSYRCECPDGWRLKPDGRSCEDINECKEHTAYCTHSESICINTRGSYKCPIVRCPEGFVKTNATGQQNSVEFISAPLTLLKIRTTGYTFYPNLRLDILRGNEEQQFDTVVTGDKAALRLLKPIKGPADTEVVLQLENRDFSGLSVISRHITQIGIFVGGNPNGISS